MTLYARNTLWCAICCIIVLALVGTVRCQERIPHPYVGVDFNLMPAGYAPFAFGFGGGLMYDTPHFILDSFAGYDTGHKENDATSNNNRGHDRFLRGTASFKFGNWYLGPGARWSQLSTTNYTKGGAAFDAGSWHPEIGGGRDWSTHRDALFMRTQVLYMFHPSKEVTSYPDGTSCDGCGNGSQGLDVSLWFPSPANLKHRHLFWRMNVVLFRFHTTITDPKNIPLTQEQVAHRSWAESGEFELFYRF
jgi:hypothetical protein